MPTYTVDMLSHVVKQAPVTILGFYANGGGNAATCDVEISTGFLFEWENKPDKSYSLPGSVTIREFQDASEAHVRSAPPGSGDVGQRMRRRIVLRDVPVSLLKAVHAASFNIYDGQFETTMDALAVPPSMIKNDFNPRASAEQTQFYGSPAASERRGGYAIAAGPVPADVRSCAFEWQLSVRAGSEADAYHFLTMLRQAARMDFHQQTMKMHEFKQRNQKLAI
jgi:hypothetical protein